AGQVLRQQSLEVAHRDVVDRRVRRVSARVVDQDVQAAVPVRGLADEAGQAGEVGHVHDRVRVPGPGTRLRHRVPVTPGHGSPLAEQHFRDGPADALRRAGDDRYLALTD